MCVRFNRKNEVVGYISTRRVVLMFRPKKGQTQNSFPDEANHKSCSRRRGLAAKDVFLDRNQIMIAN